MSILENTLSLIEIQNVNVVLNQIPILEDISLTVDPGSLHALIGPNGAGKSTLIRSLLGQVSFSGSIQFHWRSSGRIGYVPQSISIDPAMPLTVQDFLTLTLQKKPIWLGVSRSVRQMIEPALNELGILGLIHRHLSVLSGGELRRVLLAQALMPEPELLLLDEPGGGIDWLAFLTVERCLLRLREAGKTIVMVTHDLDQVKRIANQVTCLNRSIRFSGAPASVLTEKTAFLAFSPQEEQDA